MTRASACALLVAGFVSGCNALLGIADVPAAADASAAGSDSAELPAVDASDATVDAGGASMDAVVSADASVDAPPLEASACGDTTSNAHNCGRCGHDCLGGQCALSRCQPFALVAGDSGVAPYRLAQDDSFLYWTDFSNSKVERTDKVSATTIVLTRATTAPVPIAVDDGGILWGDATGVWFCPKAGCAVAPSLVANEMSVLPEHLAIDAVNVYWTEAFGFVLTASRSGSNQPATVLWGLDAGFDGSTYVVATDGQRVYFTGSDGLLRGVAVDGSAPLAIGPRNANGSAGVTLDTDNVYWSEPDPVDGSILLASKSSLTPVGIASGQSNPGAIATDGTNVYWLGTTSDGGSGAVSGCTITSCTPAMLGSGYTYVASIVVDGNAIYWTDNGSTSTNGSIWKLAK